MTDAEIATLLTEGFGELADLARDIDAARQSLMRADARFSLALHTLEKRVQDPVERPVVPPSTGPHSAAEHRRQHRPGVPAKIEADPELRAFILARIDRMTFYQLQDAIAAAFPPDRRVAKSAIHRWWTKNRPPSHPA